ncbi:MAG: tRNA (adenosine(37)-N6)-threonylcarbamoyltransferase complex dimerization subunit type 1 TsaB [Kiritimatiellae bacterium]|nr:tRNA (adenosine(37)-N6)-threonylcarbamoyltransferase complex dimerization subunit type 1 TsaB [Kiritimatiellia bacterium]
MIVLAIEQSTASGSLALLCDGDIRARRSWLSTRANPHGLFTQMPDLLAEAGVELAAVDHYVVGLGPGSFTGLRSALSAAHGFALPARVPVYGLSSGEGLALALCGEFECQSVTLCGDARRESLWLGEFTWTDGRLAMAREWALVRLADLGAVLSGGTLLASPDWDRLSGPLRTACPPGVSLLEKRCMPEARAVGLAAWQRLSRGIPSDPLNPIYLHPPVGRGEP